MTLLWLGISKMDRRRQRLDEFYGVVQQDSYALTYSNKTTTTKPINVMGEDVGIVEEVLGRSLEQQDGLEC